jgi:hypothetical protein
VPEGDDRSLAALLVEQVRPRRLVAFSGRGCPKSTRATHCATMHFRAFWPLSLA